MSRVVQADERSGPGDERSGPGKGEEWSWLMRGVVLADERSGPGRLGVWSW